MNEREGTKWLIIKAVLTGLFAMALDLLIDPVYTRLQKWYWLNGSGDVLTILSIPFSNFWGWFVLIAAFAIYWEKLCALPETRGYSVRKTIGIYVPTLFALEFVTVLVVGGLTVLLAMIPGLWGMNFTIGGI